jgi:hypothetical protein
MNQLVQNTLHISSNDLYNVTQAELILFLFQTYSLP